MEATVLSVGKSVLNGALGYAKSALAEEVALQLGVRRDQLFITNELEMMQAFLMAAHDERDDSHVVKVWVKQVRDVAYDVEDSLQEFAVRLGKQSWWRICRMLHDRRHVANKMKELRANVEDVSKRNKRYHLISKGSSSRPTTTTKPTIAGAIMSGTDETRRQREEAKVDLVRLMNNKHNSLKVISVWQKGTCSDPEEKSIIIKMAYEHMKIHKEFECQAWIGLIRPFNSTEFLQTVLHQFYINFLQEAQEEEKVNLEAQVLKMMGMTKEDDLACELKKYLNEKSYLIVLNNVHTIEEWKRIKIFFPDNKKGSRLVVYTDQVEVASLCIGASIGAPEHKQLSVDQTLYAFYDKDPQDGTNSTKAGPSSNLDNTAGSNGCMNRKALGRTDTMLTAFKESQLIGREKEKSDIINLITKEDSHQRDVISVWGMGGLGKTTLVRDVYQSQELSSGKFEKRACATIMRPFNRNDLLNNLATQLGCAVADLGGKKYLIVLDDLSSNTEWDSIKEYFPLVGTSSTSRIIVTTRVKDIALHCSRNHKKIYELEALGQKDARDLFMEKVFGKNTILDEKYPELIEQANGILKKCRGLPLAIVTIGGFLANQPKTASEWRKLNEHISAELDTNPELEIIRTILIKSYDGLPYYLKSCFLYMPIFPEDYKVRRSRLVRRWTAEGYSRDIHGKCAEEISDGFFMELVNRSMILPCQQSICSTKGIDSCQVHDLMREIGISKSAEENLVFRLEEDCSSNNMGTSRHITINNNWKGDQIEFESIVDISRVRSITVFGKWKSFFISDKMTMLRVLDLEDTRGLYDHHIKHIGKLLHLRYLSLKGCADICHLPNSLGNLRQLETLDVKGTSIIKLPKTIIKLGKLTYVCAGSMDMDISYEEVVDELPDIIRYRLCVPPTLLCMAFCNMCDDEDGLNYHDKCTSLCCFLLPIVKMQLDGTHGVVVPRGMRKLKALRALGDVNISQGKDVLKDIEGLVQLRKLGVTGINKKNGQEFCSAISALSRLESLSILSEGKQGLCGCLDGRSSPPESLLSLRLYGNLVRLPAWIKGLKNLVKLKLRSTELSDAGITMKVLGKLPNLASLHLLSESFLQNKEGFCLNFQKDAFPSLLVLEICAIKPIKFEEAAAPKLELLKFVWQDINSDTISGLPSLSGLKEVLLEGNYLSKELEYLRAELYKNLNKPVYKMV